MSSSIRPLSPPRPSSASVTTTTVSTSPPTSTSRSSAGGGGGGGGGVTTASSSVSSPPPPLPHAGGFGVAPGNIGGAAQQQHQQHQHHPHHLHHFHPPPPPNSNTAHLQGAGPTNTITTTTTATNPNQPPPRRHNNSTVSTSASAAALLPSPTNPAHLPTSSQQAQIAQARTALVASIGNALDTELQTRASLLHANQAAIEKQERDVERALRDLRKEDDKLLKVLNEGSRKVKELGDVQNWAERLERDFLVLEETMRLVNRGQGPSRRRGSGSESGSESGSWSGSGSESGSWSGSEEEEGGSVVGDEGQDEEGDVRMQDGMEENGVAEESLDKGKGKQVAMASDAMDLDPAQVPLPTEDALIPATNNNNSHAETAEQSPQTIAQPSPGATSWFKRFIWRAPG